MNKRFQMFTTLIAKCSREIKRLKSSEMEELNLKSPYVSCLYYLYIEDRPLTAKQLRELCDEDKSYLSKSLDYLEKEGYVNCISKTEKRYNSPINLTKKGEDVAKQVVDRINGFVDVASEGISAENREIFYSTFNLILKNLEKITKKNGD